MTPSGLKISKGDISTPQKLTFLDKYRKVLVTNEMGPAANRTIGNWKQYCFVTRVEAEHHSLYG